MIDPAAVTPLGWRCPIVADHRPVMHQRAGHHVWPLYLGGPEDGPEVGICHGCHGDCHLLIEAARKHGWALTAEMHRGYARRVVELAQAGIIAAQSKTLPYLPQWAKEAP